MDDYWVWCGSCVKGEDGRFHLFASRWPKSLPMHPGWIVASEIVRASADRPDGPYAFEEVVLPARGAEYWDGRSTHNPHIVKHGDTYLLFYMGSTHPLGDPEPGDGFGLSDPRCIVGRANKRIGLATANSVFGPWTRADEPILQTRPGRFDSFLTSNPAPVVHEDGSVLLIYKARQYEGNTHGRMTIGAAQAEHYLGPYRVLSEEPVFPPDRFHLEDPFVWYVPAVGDANGEGGAVGGRGNGESDDGRSEVRRGRDEGEADEGGSDGGESSRGSDRGRGRGGWYELIAKDMDGNLCGEKYGGVRARSADGLTWTLCEDGPKAYSRHIRWDDGTEQVLGNMERPFLLFQDGKPTHLFAAVSDGATGFTDATGTWNQVFPLDSAGK
ncbi:glycoside hydrolase family protein [Paenibacillus koleovorans]|uniref:glycoside hydrolase family protein n=1 Tax=Paenibacillus koleovorans TaxID=121608 RepID=UPI001FE60C38|nr:glycoside hydrolase family protein [Paenibacillus koleovorans]